VQKRLRVQGPGYQMPAYCCDYKVLGDQGLYNLYTGPHTPLLCLGVSDDAKAFGQSPVFCGVGPDGPTAHRKLRFSGATVYTGRPDKWPTRCVQCE
jgi:hypothetical protein